MPSTPLQPLSPSSSTPYTLCWVLSEGPIQAITSVFVVRTPRGLLLTATAAVAVEGEDVQVLEHIPVALVQGGAVLEYVSSYPSSATASVVTRWSPNHAPISPARLWYLTLKEMYHPKRKAPSPDTDTAPGMMNHKVRFKLQKPISQSPPEHPRPTWDRSKVQEVVPAFWTLPNDVHDDL